LERVTGFGKKSDVAVAAYLTLLVHTLRLIFLKLTMLAMPFVKYEVRTFRWAGRSWKAL